MKKRIKYLLISLLLAPFLYLLTAYLFTLFPTKKTPNATHQQNVYILYNEMHSDIVFKIEDFNKTIFPMFQDKKRGYLAFGWGDKETYLHTPTWDDLSLSTSLKALFINTPSLMHISYLPNIQQYQIKTIKISNKEKENLKNSILKDINFRGQKYKGYGKEDYFYRAYKPYNLFNTCNTWTGDKLRNANIPMSYWTPFAWSVVSNLP